MAGFALVLLVSFCWTAAIGQSSNISLSATRVYGHFGSLTANGANTNGEVSPDTLHAPQSVSVDAGGGVYVADTNACRVLFFPFNSTTATRVYGQTSFFAGSCSSSASATTLLFPQGVSVDATGVYVSDTGNNRVLFFEGTSTIASRVYGQSGLFNASATNQNGSVSADSLSGPVGVFADGAGVYIADSGNSRILYFAGNATTASQVYGQNDFSSGGRNKGQGAGVTVSGLSNPRGVFADASGVYITDTDNSRVLKFPLNSSEPIVVYGQLNNFLSQTANLGGVSSTSLAGPHSVYSDGSMVHIVDSGNNRVLGYPGFSTNATLVFGQLNSFSTSSFNVGGFVSANGLNAPYCVYGSGSSLWVADPSNNRVLKFFTNLTVPVAVYGQGNSFSGGDANSARVSASGLSSPAAVFADGSGFVCG